MLVNDILSGMNTVVLLLLAWFAREWWRDHKTQHRELAEALDHLKNGVPSKHAVERAHARIDEIEARTIDHDLRLTSIESHMGINAEACANTRHHRKGR